MKILRQNHSFSSTDEPFVYKNRFNTMSLRSGLFSYKLSPNQEFDESIVETVLKQQFSGLSIISRVQLFDGLMVIFGANSNRLTMTLRLYSSKRLVSLNAEECVESDEESKTKSNYLLNNLNGEKLRSKLISALNVSKVERLPIVKRATNVPNYYTSSDDRLLEYDFEEILFEEKSDFQCVKILRSPSLGNCLLLDDLQNLAEKDINYTQGLMKFGQISYKDKEILILGGGDGGLLHELLKEEPKFVTMVDIDAMVMNACRQHLRGACGHDLDNFEGNNYRVIVGDCIKYMEQYIESNRSFDYVFNDLTDIPISDVDSKDAILESDQELWAFFRRILNLALQLVRPDGSYLNHVSNRSDLNSYQNL